jgi:REP element-mobilizing transposase RayT
MEERFADKFRIKSGRLNSWDYSTPGIYFVTICTLNHNNFLGKIKNGSMIHSNKGKLAYKCLINIPINFTNIKLIKYAIMPNHVHILLKLKNKKLNITSRDVIKESRDVITKSRDVINHVSTKTKKMQENCPMKKFGLGTIIRWYKAKTSKEIRNNNLFFAWQSRYYDEIIFDKERLKVIFNYIKNNPKNWEKDKFYLK